MSAYIHAVYNACMYMHYSHMHNTCFNRFIYAEQYT